MRKALKDRRGLVGIMCSSATLALLVLSGCSSSSETVKDSPPPDPPSFTVTAETRNIVSVVVVEGTVEARPVLAVTTPHAGTVAAKVKIGAKVEPGTKLATVGDEVIVSTVSGTVTDILISDPDYVAANIPVITISYAGFGVRLVVPPEQLFRLYQQPVVAKVNVKAGPAGLGCALSPAVYQNGPDDASVFCLIPLDAAVVPGLAAKVGINTGMKDDVVALPVGAVSGSSGQGEVTVVRGKERILTTVHLGITDGAYIEIIDGVKAGDVVLSYSPQLE